MFKSHHPIQKLLWCFMFVLFDCNQFLKELNTALLLPHVRCYETLQFSYCHLIFADQVSLKWPGCLQILLELMSAVLSPI